MEKKHNIVDTISFPKEDCREWKKVEKHCYTLDWLKVAALIWLSDGITIIERKSISQDFTAQTFARTRTYGIYLWAQARIECGPVSGILVSLATFVSTSLFCLYFQIDQDFLIKLGKLCHLHLDFTVLVFWSHDYLLYFAIKILAFSV